MYLHKLGMGLQKEYQNYNEKKHIMGKDGKPYKFFIFSNNVARVWHLCIHQSIVILIFV